MEKILLDTDIGGDIDDAICLAYLLKEPRCDLLGITTVCGEPEKRAAVADAICRAAGRRIPIVAGLDTTLQPIPVYPTPEGAAALDRWPHDAFAKGDAPAFLCQKIRENPHEVVLIAIGNLTNVATLFTDYPDSVGLLKGLFVMNGYFGAEPLPDPYYNWNAWADPLAAKIAFAARPSVFRAVPLEITDRLTIEARQAEVLLRADSDLMRAVFSFGNAWLESSEKLTLHDPLAAVSVFHPEVCRFARGRVEVETERERDMGGTAFTPCEDGNVEIACAVDREQFYRILPATLRAEPGRRRRALPPLVVRRAKSLGAVGEAWLANLDAMIAELEAEWQISVGEALPGGSRAFVACADGPHGEPYALKIDLPEDMGGEFFRGMAALRMADGRGCAKVYAFDPKRRACLLERLGKPINRMGFSVREQIGILCALLQQTWKIPVQGEELLRGEASIAWFRDFLGETWEQLGRPCPKAVIDYALSCLRAREAALDPTAFAWVHGDAHGGNALATGAGDGCKRIDPDGLFCERAYDLGVLMREWMEEYEGDPVGKARQRCRELCARTGVPERGIWEWGVVQTVSTAFVFLQIGQAEAGRRMLEVAACWSAAGKFPDESR